MRDPRIILSQELARILQPVGLPLFTYVPDNVTTPYIYVGNIEIVEDEENPNKDTFMLEVTMNLTLYSGNNEWIGSKLPLYNYLDGIKQLMQPTKGAITFDLNPIFDMKELMLGEDAGFETPNEEIRLYTSNLAYVAKLEQLIDFIEEGFNVIHGADNVIHNLDNVTYTLNT